MVQGKGILQDVMVARWEPENLLKSKEEGGKVVEQVDNKHTGSHGAGG